MPSHKPGVISAGRQKAEAALQRASDRLEKYVSIDIMEIRQENTTWSSMELADMANGQGGDGLMAGLDYMCPTFWDAWATVSKQKLSWAAYM